MLGQKDVAEAFCRGYLWGVENAKTVRPPCAGHCHQSDHQPVKHFVFRPFWLSAGSLLCLIAAHAFTCPFQAISLVWTGDFKICFAAMSHELSRVTGTSPTMSNFPHLCLHGTALNVTYPGAVLLALTLFSVLITTVRSTPCLGVCVPFLREWACR
jgi:hypothetical protein